MAIRNKHTLISLILTTQLLLIAIISQQISKKYSPKIPPVDVLGVSEEITMHADHNPEGTNLKYFYEPTPNTVDVIKLSWLEESPHITITDQGFNETREYSLIKPKDTVRIITIGDSFTYGQFINTKDNFSERLKDKLNAKCIEGRTYEVINLGMWGYDLEYAVERFRMRGTNLNPDIIIWLIKSDDFAQINEVVLPEQRRLYSIFSKEESLGDLLSNNNLYKKVIAPSIEKQNQIYDESSLLNYQKNIISTLQKYANGKILLTTFYNTSHKYQNILKEIASNSNKYFFSENIQDIYKNKELFLEDSHPSKKGHEQIALDILSILKKNQLISCENEK